MTKYPDLFTALAAPFDRNEVRFLPKGGKRIAYVTARAVMNRLDSVVGPENWWDRYAQRENSVLCELTIRLPDGATVTKCDAGGHAGMSDQGDDEKSAVSDAFKRAAVKFGVGRELYGDGVADLAAPEPTPTPAPAPAPAPAPGTSPGAPCAAATGPVDPDKPWATPRKTDERSYAEFIVDSIEYCNRTIRGIASEVDASVEEPDLVQLQPLEKALHAKLVSQALRPRNEDRRVVGPARTKLLGELYVTHRKEVRIAILELVENFADNARKKLRKFAGKGEAYEASTNGAH